MAAPETMVYLCSKWATSQIHSLPKSVKWYFCDRVGWTRLTASVNGSDGVSTHKWTRNASHITPAQRDKNIPHTNTDVSLTHEHCEYSLEHTQLYSPYK